MRSRRCKGFGVIEAVAALVIVTICVLALGKLVLTYNEKLREEGRAEIRAEWNAEKATMAENARKQEAAWQAQKQGLLDENAKLQKDRDAAKSQLAVSTSSLRLITDKYVALHSAASNTTSPSGSTSIAALGNSFSECTDTLSKMATELDDSRARGSLAEALYLKISNTVEKPPDKPSG